MQPSEILKKQRDWQQSQSNGNDASTELHTYLQISISDSLFLISISQISEVSEILPIRMYPVHLEGYLGVINLRGKVIPVVSMERFGGKKDWRPGDRIVLVNINLASSGIERFALIADSVKKISAPYADTGSVITLADKPIRVISGNQILESWGD